jgi:hypothetical protein
MRIRKGARVLRPGMRTSATGSSVPEAASVTITRDSLTVNLGDGRTITVPFAWFPRLLHGSPPERKKWKIISRGKGIHWEELDEDISVEGLLAGRGSQESQQSFKKWLQYRSKAAA